jgi:SAM-dependent methyltransferase
LILRPTTRKLLDRVGIPRSGTCLDVGCGEGDVTVELARRVGPQGRAVGIDLDEVKLGLAQAEAWEQGLDNVEFRLEDATGPLGEAAFDVVYARLLLTHLPDPVACIQRMHDAVAPGGLLLVEDIDCTGYFSYPDSPAVRRCLELYNVASRQRGGDPGIGPRLPMHLVEAGFEQVGVNIIRPVGLEGEVKLLAPLLLECIADAALSDGLVSPEELGLLLVELSVLARDRPTVAGLPRVVQSWGSRAR